jgi:PRC-barrel domain protein
MEATMLKTVLITTAISGLVMSGAATGAWAQDQKGGASAQSSPKFISSQSADQWVFSKFKGTDVLGPDNSHIGDVSDVLFDKSGKILGIVVGVGGFLGIGQKNVAMDMSAFQVVPANTGGSSTGVTTSSNDPTNVKLKVSWSKEQLQNAPDFQYYKAPSAAIGSGSTSGIGRPSPMSPAPATRQ